MVAGVALEPPCTDDLWGRGGGGRETKRIQHFSYTSHESGIYPVFLKTKSARQNFLPVVFELLKSLILMGPHVQF